MTPSQRNVCLAVLWGAFALAMLVILNNLRIEDGMKASVTLVLDACALTGTWLILRARHLVAQDI